MGSSIRMRAGISRARGRRGDASTQVILSTVVATLILSAVILFTGLKEGAPAAAGTGKGGEKSAAAAPEPWDARGVAAGDNVPRRSGLDGSLDVARLRAAFTPLVSTSAAADTGKTHAKEPVAMALQVSVADRAEDGAKAGYGEIGGPDRKVPVLIGSEAFPNAVALPIKPDSLKGWGKRFKGK